MSIIRELRKKHNLSQKELSEICGVHQTAVSQWEKERTQPDIKSLKKLAEIFGVGIETLVGKEPAPDENKIPVFSFISAAELCNKLGEREYFALTVTDDSMSPVLFSGDTVIVSRSAEIISGDIAAISVGNGNTVLRKIIKKDTSTMLVSENTSYEPMVFTKAECETLPLFIIGKAVEMRRKL